MKSLVRKPAAAPATPTMALKIAVRDGVTAYSTLMLTIIVPIGDPI